jgi:hypothetical protein
MKCLRTLVLFDQGNIVSSTDWRNLFEGYRRSIESIEHPKGAGGLFLPEIIKLPDGQWKRNGVKYLRKEFLRFMQDVEKWHCEGNVALARDRDQPPILLYPSLEEYREPITSDFGNFDFMSTAENGSRIAIEWETGNISSSHRSMNKLAIALMNDVIDIGVLIVPSRSLYNFLTDRIGNIGELSGYLSMWVSLKSQVKRGLLAITVVEHDGIDNAAPFLPVGSDGLAKKKPAKKAVRQKKLF